MFFVTARNKEQREAGFQHCVEDASRHALTAEAGPACKVAEAFQRKHRYRQLFHRCLNLSAGDMARRLCTIRSLSEDMERNDQWCLGIVPNLQTWGRGVQNL